MLERKRKIDAVELQRLKIEEKSNSEIARHFGVSVPAVTQALKRMKTAMAEEIVATPSKVERITDTGIKMAERYQQIAGAADRVLLDASKGSSPWSRKMVLDACRVIKEQLEFQAKMIDMLHDFNTMQEFQQEVMAVIGEESPDARARILRRLEERRTLRLSLERPRMERRNGT